MHDAAAKERCRDTFYRILVHEECPLRNDLVDGLRAFIRSKSSHPVVDELLSPPMTAMVERGIILGALAYEADFLQHMLTQDGMCSSALSQYAVRTLPPLVESLLDGNLEFNDFVLHATHLYTTL